MSRPIAAVFLLLGIAAVGWLVPWPRSSGYRLPNERGWGEPGTPGSAQGRQFARANIVSIRAGGVTVRVNRRAARNFSGFLDELAATGYRIRPGDTGGYNHRANRNRPEVLSEHSWGTAVDVNWRTNPNTSDCTLVTDLPDGIADRAQRWGLRWGGDFGCPHKDSMHFEVRGTPRDASEAVQRAAEKPAVARAARER